jgi:WD40 repeat protein
VSNPRHPSPAGEIRHGSNVTGAAFTSDDRILATSSAGGTFALTDVTTRGQANRLFQSPYNRSSIFEDVAVSPDRRTLAVANTYSTTQATALWDISVPRRPVQIMSLLAHNGVARRVAFSPDAATLATVGDDGDGQLWDVRWLVTMPDRLRERACITAGGDPTELEWSVAVKGIPYQRTC